VQKVQSLERADWGMNTDFVKAMQKIAELVQNERLEQHDIPDLLVISDMQLMRQQGPPMQTASERSPRLSSTFR
jgi:hypothetical protein